MQKRAGTNIRSYNPLDPKAPELPSKGQIKSVIPKRCFERSYHSMYFVCRDAAWMAALVYIAYKTLSTDLPSHLLSLEALWWVVGWNAYAFWGGGHPHRALGPGP